MQINQKSQTLQNNLTYLRSQAASGKKFKGDKLILAIIISLAIMSAAVILALKLAIAIGTIWVGFLPLSIGWLILYPIFKKL